VIHTDGLSAHADSVELLEWLRRVKRAPELTFVTHGEPAASNAFRERIASELGWRAEVPQDGQQVRL
jgi:metallo-beta-lactamase family protein